MVKTATSVYDRRVANECRDAADLQVRNTDVIRFDPPTIQGGDTILAVTIFRTTGLLMTADGPERVAHHAAEFRFPRFYPSVPIEAYLRRPVFHPNVDPVNGFVCLWDRFTPGDTIATAALYLQRIIAWRMFNLDADHVICPEAAAWRRNVPPGVSLPLEYTELALPDEWNGLDVYPSRVYCRRRLE